MATIKHSSDEFNGNVANTQFAAGKAETDNPGAIRYFRRHSETYTVAGDKPAKKVTGGGSGQQEKPLDKRTNDEIEAYAAEHDIDLDGATTKAEMLAAIAAAEDESGS